MADDNTGEAPQPAESNPTLTRPSTAFERPPGNVFIVPDDEGSPLDDVSERPTIVAPVAVDRADECPTHVQEDPVAPPEER